MSRPPSALCDDQMMVPSKSSCGEMGRPCKAPPEFYRPLEFEIFSSQKFSGKTGSRYHFFLALLPSYPLFLSSRNRVWLFHRYTLHLASTSTSCSALHLGALWHAWLGEMQYWNALTLAIQWEFRMKEVDDWGIKCIPKELSRCNA